MRYHVSVINSSIAVAIAVDTGIAFVLVLVMDQNGRLRFLALGQLRRQLALSLVANAASWIVRVIVEISLVRRGPDRHCGGYRSVVRVHMR